MTRLDLLPQFLVGWDNFFIIKCIICSSVGYTAQLFVHTCIDDTQTPKLFFNDAMEPTI